MSDKFIKTDKAAQILKLLGDKTRLMMIQLMRHRECCVCEFQELFVMSQPAISQHLRKLKDSGALNEEKRGQWVFYSLNQSSEYFALIEAILGQLAKPNDALQKISSNTEGSDCGC